MLTNRWLWLAVLFLIRITLGFQFQSVGSVSSPLRADLGIGHAEIGTLIGLYMLPGVVIALPSGLLIKRFGDMRTASYGDTARFRPITGVNGNIRSSARPGE